MLKKEITLSLLPQWNVSQPPIGIAYLSAYLQKFDYKVHLRDFSIEMYHDLPAEKKSMCEGIHQQTYVYDSLYHSTFGPEIAPYLESWAQELARSSSPFLGFSVLKTNRITTAIVAARVKALAPEKIIILGGPQCTRYDGGYSLVLENYADFVVPDEGEEVLHELLECLVTYGFQIERIKKIPGLLFFPAENRVLPRSESITTVQGMKILKDDRIVDTGERELIKSINDIPFPDFSDFKLTYYKSLTLPILGSRGCVYECSFCSETVLWKRFRYRSAEKIFLEMKVQIAVNRSNVFFIVDSLINGNMRELEKLCDLLIAARFKIIWGGKASIRREMSAALLKKMADAGCRYLYYGLESGSPTVVKDMKKGFDIPTAVRVIRETSEAGIHVSLFMMVGFPTETQADYQMSKDFITANRQYINHVAAGFGFGPQEGSDTYFHPEKYGMTINKDGTWYSRHITPEIMQERVNDFRNFCKVNDLLGDEEIQIPEEFLPA